MPRSIRWRLVLSYMLLAFGSVAMVGWLTLALIDRRLEAQEIDYLTANAEAIARQAALSIEAGARTAELEQLAGAAAFLGDVQVRILDEQSRVLVDSGAPSELQEMAWIVPPPTRGRPAGREAPPLFLFDQRGFAGLDGLFPFDPRLLEELMLSEWGGALEDPLTGMLDVIVVQRSSSPWGDLLDFEYGLYLDDADVGREPASALAPPSAAGTANETTGESAGEETAAIRALDPNGHPAHSGCGQSRRLCGIEQRSRFWGGVARDRASRLSDRRHRRDVAGRAPRPVDEPLVDRPAPGFDRSRGADARR